MQLKPGKPVKLNGETLSRLDAIRDQSEGYSVSVGKLITIAEAVDSNLKTLGRLK